MYDHQAAAARHDRARRKLLSQQTTIAQARTSVHPYTRPCPTPRPHQPQHNPTPASIIPDLLSHPDIPLTQTTADGLARALENGLAKGTVLNYNSSVRRFLAFCDRENIPACKRFPADEFVLCAFVGSLTGDKSGQTIANTLSGLKAWHALRGEQWSGNKLLKHVTNRSAVLAPSTSKREARPPVTTDLLIALHDGLSLDSSFDSSVLCAATIAVFGQCRAGELFGSSRRHHDPRLYPSRADFIPLTTPSGYAELRLPSTKTDRVSGQSVFLTAQRDPVCPITTTLRHLRRTWSIPNTHHLFAFTNSSGGISCLTAEAFLTRCNEIWSSRGIPRITGHSFRIGGTNTYLAAGVPDDIVKKMGRWSSDAYLRYWRGIGNLAQAHARNI